MRLSVVMRTLDRLALAALCTDLALYLLMLSLPYRVLGHGASSLVIGLVPLLYAGPYSVIALTAGTWSDRWPRRGPIRAGLALALLGAIGLARAQSLNALLACVPLVGIGLGFFWPSLQAGFSEVSAGRDLERTIQRFNVAWSTGKGIGLLGGGMLFDVVGPSGLAWIAAGSWMVAASVLPTMARPGDHSSAVASDARVPSVARQSAFLRSAWWINGMAFAVAATLNHHLPKAVLGAGIDARGVGTFLGLVFLSQMLLFVVVGRRRDWPYRSAPLLAVTALVAVSVTIAPHLHTTLALALLAPLLGVGLGFAYQSSLYYSLHASHGRGRRAGVHEAMLGIASATLPVAGGAVARAGGGVFAPFVVTAVAMGAVLVLASAWLWRARD